MTGLHPPANWFWSDESPTVTSTTSGSTASELWNYLVQTQQVFEGKVPEMKKPFSVDLAVSKGVIWPYADYSRGAKELAKEMGMVRMKTNDAHYILSSGPISRNMVVVNWGNFKLPNIAFNPPYHSIAINGEGVKECADKMKFFEMMTGKVRIPETSKKLEDAMKWIADGETVFGRKSRGSGGTDICFYDTDPEAFASSDFYSLYKKKKDEFRVHIVDNDVILVQRKAVRDTDDDGNVIDKSKIDFRIRNHKNGFVFKRYDVHAPDDVIEQAQKAIKTAGLDFGAVDVIFNQHEGRAYVLEVNTAPGLEGTTVIDYAKALRGLIQKRLDNS